ncbi:MAG: succinyl-diaminopimelate desuccinylase [Candidatus Tokpelaia sp. JSC188]|nr:MAG: succinyl-diaminopimelate desuccinylase [Candidatus Tokpelaia sp. JSC188]
MQYTDPVLLLQQLLRFRSITPNEGGAFSFLQAWAEKIGFRVERPIFHDYDTPDVENFYAECGNDTGPHLMFAGHMDVVSPGDESCWKYPPFAGDIIGQILYGRGAVDMKGAIACFLIALARVIRKQAIKGIISLLITGDEEGPAINGTVKILQWAAKKGKKWDAAIVGEPTCCESLGDMIKIGRRGSLSGVLTVCGCQGHVAYPHLAHNPLPDIVTLLGALINEPFDNGNENFQPSNLEFTSIDTANQARNVIPAEVKASFNIRFNDHWSAEALKAEIEQRLKKAAKIAKKGNNNLPFIDYTIAWTSNPASAFLTYDKQIINAISDAITKISGNNPQVSTCGGTSDARFIKSYCPVVEFGLIGKTMHKIDECVAVDDLKKLTSIYQLFIEEFFAKQRNIKHVITSELDLSM